MGGQQTNLIGRKIPINERLNHFLSYGAGRADYGDGYTHVRSPYFSYVS
jgi:hypothetical protein